VQITELCNIQQTDNNEINKAQCSNLYR